MVEPEWPSKEGKRPARQPSDHATRLGATTGTARKWGRDWACGLSSASMRPNRAAPRDPLEAALAQWADAVRCRSPHPSPEQLEHVVAAIQSALGRNRDGRDRWRTAVRATCPWLGRWVMDVGDCPWCW